VITDVDSRYYGVVVNDQSLTPGASPRIGATFFEYWLERYLTQKNVSEAGSQPDPKAPLVRTQQTEAA
jgi:hypothetical protein